MARFLTRRLIPLALANLVWAGAGCGTARHRAEADVVRSVRFEGNQGWFSGHSDYQLRTQMEQQATAWGLSFPIATRLVTPEQLDRSALMRDAYRLEVWYAHNGWFDARIQGWAVREIKPQRRRRAAVVDVIGLVEPGEPSVLRSFPWEGLNRNAQVLASSVRRGGEIREGHQFNLEYVYLTRDRLLDKFRDHAYAYVSVDLEMDAYPAEHAVDVTFHVTQGISAELGDIAVEGNDKVPERTIRENLRFSKGDPYKVTTLRNAQRNLFAMGTFALVSVDADLSDPTRVEVPVAVQVVESKFRTFRAGAGLNYNGLTLTPRVSSSFRHNNLLGHLIRLELAGSFGYALGMGRASGSSGFPIYSAHVSTTHPRLFSRHFQLSVQADVEQDLQAGQLPYLNPAASLSMAWKATDYTTVRLGAGLEHYAYLQLAGPAELAARAAFGEDFENPYQLTTIDLRIMGDWRNDPLYTSRGVYWQAGVRQAVPALVGDYVYTDISGDFRGFYTLLLATEDSGGVVRALGALFDHRVTAGRVHGRVLQPWGGSALPYPEMAFLGGSTNLRGFRLDQVGPYDCLCRYDPADGGSFSGKPGAGLEVDQDYLPQGGTVSAGVSAELRHPFLPGLIGGLTMVLPFVDAGVLARTIDDLGVDDLRWGTGVGFRYASVVGPIRLDLTFRPLYPEDAGPDQFINCLYKDREPRTIDLANDLSDLFGEYDPSTRRLPVMVNLYLAIGEAF